MSISVQLRQLVARSARKVARSPRVRRLMAEHPGVETFASAGSFETATGVTFTRLRGYRDHIVPRWRGMFASPPADVTVSPVEVATARAAVGTVADALAPWGVELSGARVLEVGCHSGTHSYALAERGASVVGIDIPDYGVVSSSGRQPTPTELADQSRRLSALREAAGTQFDSDAIGRVQFRDCDVADLSELAAYDVVVSWETLEHVGQPGEALLRLADALRPGGVMFHEYNPFFAVDGGHSLCTLDFPWGHAVLSEADFERYVRVHRPTEADRAVAFHRDALNRMTLAELQERLDRAGLQVLALLPWLERHDLALLDAQTLDAAVRLYPSVTPADLLARRVWIIARREAAPAG